MKVFKCCRLSERPVVKQGMLILIVLGFLSYFSNTSAFELTPNLQFHAFASQSYILTSSNNFFGNSEEGSFDFREIGLNGSWRALSNLQFSAQALVRNAGESDDGDLRLDYGFADYTLLSDADHLWGIRLGRIITPFGLYNDTRDVAFTRPSILLPQSIYFDRTRNLALSADGIHVYGEKRAKWGDLFFQLGGVLPRVNNPEVEKAILSRDFPGQLDAQPSLVGRIMYEINGGQFRFALTGVQLNADYDPGGLMDPLRDGSFKFEPVIISGQYNAEKWSLTGEYALRRLSYKNFGPLLRDLEFTGESYYLQAVYRFKPYWEGFIRYDVFFTDRDDRSGKKFAAVTGRPAHTRFAKDLTFGVRWDVTPSFMLRAEVHQVNGTGWITVSDNRSVNDLDQHWTLFSLLASYRF